MLTADRLKALLHYSPETGAWTWLVPRQGVAHCGAIAGDINARGYRRISVDRRRYMAHVLACLYMTGRFPLADMDHINGDRADNRWSNLREVSRSANNENQRCAQQGNKSGFLGVSPNRKRWSASIMVRGRKHHLGTFDTPEQAHTVYLAAKRESHAGNTL